MPLRATAALTLLALTGAGALLPAHASPGDPVDPRTEARNFAKTRERAGEYRPRAAAATRA